MTRLSLALIALIPVWFAVSAQAAPSGAPAALIVDKSGSVTPDVSPFSEVTAGTVLSLGDDAKLVFDDYYSCTEVTVTGGKIEFTSKGYTTSGGAKKSETRVPCKQEVALKQSGEASTSLLRGSEGRRVRLGIRPRFVLVGKQSTSFATAKFTANGNEVLNVQLTGPRFEWPADAAPLTAATRYELILVPKSAGQPASTINFVATAPKASQDQSLVLIRVDCAFPTFLP